MTEPAADAAVETPDTGAEPAQAGTDWKAEARKWEQRAKENRAKLEEAEPIVSQWRQLEEASKTELERTTEELSRWQSEAERWRSATVTSRIEALAAPDFAYPADAVTKLDAAKYLGADGAINEAAIQADLAALLDERPNWRRAEQAPAGPRIPAPNHAQGRAGGAATDPKSEFASFIQGAMNRS